jgi:glutamine amidotransferase
MKVAVIKYNAGNIQSVLFALQRAGVNAIVSNELSELSTADKIIFPGVGEASSAMNYLKQMKLDDWIRDCKKPFLGICLGMQLLCRYSEEGNTNTIGIFPVNVKKFKSTDEDGNKIKVPQMGWNTATNLKSSLFDKVPDSSFFYYVHSFYAECNPYSIAETDYGIKYCSALHRDNFYAVQFHPEKSSIIGERVLNNFLQLI